MQETVIVDGQTMLPHLPRPPRNPKSAKTHLFRLLTDYSKEKGCRVVVVFNSKEGVNRLPRREGVRATFTEKGEKINSFILGLVRRSVDVKKVVVASWNRDLLAEARKLGAKGLPGFDLIKEFEKRKGGQSSSGNTLREVLDERSLRALRKVARGFKR